MDRLETRDFAYFVAVAEELHFSRAADRLGIAQPVLSRAIGRIERRMGVRLFDRTSRRVTLTDAGRVFLTESRAVLAAADRAVHRAQRAAAPDQVVLAVRPGQGAGLLAAALGGFDAPVELVFARRQVVEVREGRADVALACATDDLDGLRVTELVHEAPVVLLPVGHPLATRAAVTVAELRGLAAFREQCPEVSFDKVADLVVLGRLVVVVSESAAAKLGADVVAVPVADLPPSLLVLAWAGDSPAVAALVGRVAQVAGRSRRRTA